MEQFGEIKSFSTAELQIVAQAVEIAEDVTANYFKISTSQWKHVRYDIRTLADLRFEEIVKGAFAQITRYSRYPISQPRTGRQYDYFKICLQDHNMIAAAERDEKLHLLPLAVYVVTHELVHVVRFCKFLQRFDTGPEERQKEEARVHAITSAALSPLRLSHLDYVLAAYRNYAHMEEFRDLRNPS
ncbi:MAG: hypothetical protein JRJ12_03370 [Deltaproteobacteria bacterium]|nr:hypothetical protein [Deltaproteobacteria bacterium]MBW2070269.1 hypothetical protein [Deltaproteobacteria bacterium]